MDKLHIVLRIEGDTATIVSLDESEEHSKEVTAALNSSSGMAYRYARLELPVGGAE